MDKASIPTALTGLKVLESGQLIAGEQIDRLKDRGSSTHSTHDSDPL